MTDLIEELGVGFGIKGVEVKGVLVIRRELGRIGLFDETAIGILEGCKKSRVREG